MKKNQEPSSESILKQNTAQSVKGNNLDNSKSELASQSSTKSNKKWKAGDITSVLFWIFIASILSFISFRFFIQAISSDYRTLAGGVSGVSMLIGLLAEPNNLEIQALMTFALVVIINIPFLIFGFLKVGKKFTIYSSAFVVIQLLIQVLFFALPGVNQFFVDHTFFPFKPSSGYADVELRACLNAIIGGVIYGFSCVFIYNSGACSGGADFISFYFNLKKNSAVGYMNFIVNTIIITLGILILAIARPATTNGNLDITKTIINSGIRLIGTFLYILISSFVIDKYYPKQKIMNLTIIVNDLAFLDNFLKTLSVSRSYTYLTATGGYSKKTKYMCHFVMTAYELKILKKYLKHHDTPPELFISATHSQYIIGHFKAVNLE